MKMKIIIQLGLFTLIRYKYYIDSYMWEDPQNLNTVQHGYSKKSPSIGSGTSMNVKYYQPVVLENE